MSAVDVRAPQLAHGVSLSEGVLARFLHWEAAGSVVLLAAALTTLGWANSPWTDSYLRLAHVPIAVSFGAAAFELSLQHWINDLLMAIFFFVIGLEIKREIVVGQLSSFQKAALPVAGALGGILMPAGIYAAFNAGGPGARGWGVPMATDIAFAIGILALFGKRTPLGLKVFVAALAIADDLAAVVVIALFYTETIRFDALALSGVVLLLMALVAHKEVQRPTVCVAMALLVWMLVTASKLHPTVAGVLVAMTIPVRAKHGQDRPIGQVLEEYFHPGVAFIILPLFAFFNAGVVVQTPMAEMIARPVGLGILLGLVLGKQIGIILFSWLAVTSGAAALPDRVRWVEIYGGACLAGVGFTMSLFITELAFQDEGLVTEARLAILIASLLAAAWGAAVLHLRLPRFKPVFS